MALNRKYSAAYKATYKKKLISHKPLGDTVFDIVNGIIMVSFVIIMLYPLLNTVALSFNDGTDALRGGIYLWPREFTWQNYKVVLHKESMGVAARVTILRTVIGTLSSLFVTALLSYVLSRRTFILKRQVSLLYVITMYVSGGLIPVFLLYKGLGLTNSFWVYIIPGMVSAFNMLVIRTYMHGLPDSIVESAEIDGAGHFTIFIRIIVPLCLPVFATVALFTAVYQWNSWFDAMLYNRMSDEYTTLQYELQKLLASVTNTGAIIPNSSDSAGLVTPASTRAAATVVTSLPIVCLYPFLQRYFVTGLTIGGVKE